ncbi:MAG TPA: ATP-grasp domain-containing protein [Noviherbaspirillum sp.]
MTSYVVVGKSARVVTAVLQGVHSFAGAPCVVIGNEETRRLRWSSLCARHTFIGFDGRYDQLVADVINGMHATQRDTIVIPADCPATRLIHRIRDRLEARVIPIADAPTLELMDDKWHFHQFCEQLRLRVPTTIPIGDKSNLYFNDLCETLGLPFVLKPSNESGSLGVQIVSSRAQFDALMADPEYAFDNLIAQRHIDGEDIDLSLLAIGGRVMAYAIQRARGAKLEFVEHAELTAMAKKLCAASGYNGVMHLDARIARGSGEVYLIESNPRFWATLTAAAWAGLNFPLESTRQHDGGAVRALTSGSAPLRHPLLNPTTWRTVLKDRGQQGRLGRSEILDMYMLGRLTRTLPAMAARRLGEWAGKGRRTRGRA